MGFGRWHRTERGRRRGNNRVVPWVGLGAGDRIGSDLWDQPLVYTLENKMAKIDDGIRMH